MRMLISESEERALWKIRCFVINARRLQGARAARRWASAGKVRLWLPMYEYGTKVAALLRDEAFAPAWGAAGGTLGTGAGALAGLLVLLIMFLVHKRHMRKNIKKDAARGVDSFGKIFSRYRISQHF